MKQNYRAQKGFTLIELMIVVAIIGILAAIALPAYQNYVARSQVSEAVTLASGLRVAVQEYWQTEGEWPANNTVAGVGPAGEITGKYVEQVTVDESQIQATMFNATGVSAPVRGAVITLQGADEGGSVSWTCTGSVDDKFLPSACRQ